MREKVAPLLRIASAILCLLISILIVAGNIYGVENRTYREGKINTQTVINISSVQIVADFQCYKDCLVGVRYYTGSTFESITDQSAEISGYLLNGIHFACIEKTTDRKSIFVRGLITVK